LDVDPDADFELISLLECLEERKLGSPLEFHTRRLWFDSVLKEKI